MNPSFHLGSPKRILYKNIKNLKVVLFFPYFFFSNISNQIEKPQS